MVEISILIIRSSSGNICLNLFSDTISDLVITSIQYLHSAASFSAIEYFDKKSALDWAYAQIVVLRRLEGISPRDVPLLKNCLDKTFPASS